MRMKRGSMRFLRSWKAADSWGRAEDLVERVRKAGVAMTSSTKASTVSARKSRSSRSV